MEEKIIEILKEVLEIDDVTGETSQENCPVWDSLHHLNIAVALEGEFGLDLEPEEIARMKSVKDIVRILSEKRQLK